VIVLLPRPASAHRRGFSHVEVLVSTLIVGLMLVSATSLLGGVVRSRAVSGNTARAVLLAQEMMCEIAGVSYVEATGPLFGPEAAESTGNRSLFDDVDDYNGWTESPLKTRDNATLANTSGWTRSVAVAWVDPAAPSTTVGSDQGVKRVTITVQSNGQTLARLSALRTSL
jgi:type II secretory pathway pseudopilin PulG